jgi:chromosomal replication initiation ATPase DnaA
MTDSLDPTALRGAPDGQLAISVFRALRARNLLPLLHEICRLRGVMNYELCGRSRTKGVARARHELWWRIRNHPDLCFSYLEIARLFGCDHSTVSHGVRAHQRTLAP